VGQVLHLANCQFLREKVGEHSHGCRARLQVGEAHLAHLLEFGFGQGVGVVKIELREQGAVVGRLPGVRQLGKGSKAEAFDGESGSGGSHNWLVSEVGREGCLLNPFHSMGFPYEGEESPA
jgi:hypothetical protein